MEGLGLAVGVTSGAHASRLGMARRRLFTGGRFESSVLVPEGCSPSDEQCGHHLRVLWVGSETHTLVFDSNEVLSEAFAVRFFLEQREDLG